MLCIYHGNWPGPASSPPIMRLLIEIPHDGELIRANLSAGNELGSAGVGCVVTAGMPVENIKGRSPVGLGRISVMICGFDSSIGTRIGWKFFTGRTCRRSSGISNSSDMLGGQFWNVRGSSKSKKKNFLRGCFMGGAPLLPCWCDGRILKPKLWTRCLKL